MIITDEKVARHRKILDYLAGLIDEQTEYGLGIVRREIRAIPFDDKVLNDLIAGHHTFFYKGRRVDFPSRID